MRCLTYDDLAPGGLAAKVERVRAAIERDDFRSPDIKKLNNGPYFRAKLDDSSRLLLQFASHQGQTVCLLLEVIAHHAYDKSRFLRGATVDEAKLLPFAALTPQDSRPMRYLHPSHPDFLLLDKPLSFDDAQRAVLAQRPPLILVGSAGSGKTALLLQRLRQATGRVAYVTESRWLAETSRSLYVAFDGAPEAQEADFLSYQQLLETIHTPVGRPVRFEDFRGFFAKNQQSLRFTDAHALFEELRGVLTAEPEGPFSRQAYLDLGVRQSLFDPVQREAIYDVFERYRSWLRDASLYEPNLIAHEQLPQAVPTYEFICVDEVQDLTNVQLALVLASLKSQGKFILAGDANQIVHPNYFSWAKVKSLFWRGIGEVRENQVHTLCISYRNSAEVTAVANSVLRLKHVRFGSIDRESNQLMRAVGGSKGTVSSFASSSSLLRELDQRTGLSTQVAVIVLRDEHKAEAKRIFKTPLLFSIHEAKGLEYETVILFRLVSAERSIYAGLAEGVASSDLVGDELAYRRAKDKSDKSPEIYKFFVNALYVALTRSVRDVYWVEDDVKHPLLTLLAVAPARDASGVPMARASAEDWQREAQRLEAQGKREQAEAIRRDVLKLKPVPWTTFDPINLPTLFAKALDTKVVAPKLRQQALSFAYVHDEPVTVARLERDISLGSLDNYAKDRPRLVKESMQRCLGKGRAEILKDTERYGVDHRLEVGLTPLMLAAYVGDVALVSALCARGASRVAGDHMGRNAVHWALRGAYDGFLQPPEGLGTIYDLVAPASFDVEADGRMHQIGREQGEYFLFQFMVARLSALIESVDRRLTWFSAAYVDDEVFAKLPEVVVREKRKKRAYLNHLFSRACVGSNYTPNRQLWKRESQGWYVLNPQLRLRVDNSDGTQAWKPLGEIVHAGWLLAHVEVLKSPKPWGDAQRRAAATSAPGMTEEQCQNLRQNLERRVVFSRVPGDVENSRQLIAILDEIDRGVVGKYRIGPAKNL